MLLNPFEELSSRTVVRKYPINVSRSPPLFREIARRFEIEWLGKTA